MSTDSLQHDDGVVYRHRKSTLALTVALLAVTALLCGCAASTMQRQTGSTTRSAPRRTAVNAKATTTTSPSTGTPYTTAPDATAPLRDMVVTIDPGHNGDNYRAPAVIGALIWNGREHEACDTTGTETDAGYTEAQFNFNVAQDLAADLRAKGATVVMTRTTNAGVGPCVTQRAAIGNDAHSDAAISIHADGGPTDGRGFAVLEPVADGPNDGVIAPSQALGADVRSAFLAQTTMPVSTYDGTDGIAARDDLAGLNLSTVPKVLIECGNMRNATDAALLVSPAWQHTAALAMAAGITAFLTTGAPPTAPTMALTTPKPTKQQS